LKDKFEMAYLTNSNLSIIKNQPLNDKIGFLIKNTNVTQKDLTNESKMSDFKWPFFRNAKFEHVIQKYMTSFKNIYSENINASNLCFITGPTKCGKSWFLRYNMRKF
jgi:phosphate starvation-inducible protein PhoH